MNPLLSDVERGVREQASVFATEHLAAQAASIDSAGACPDELVELLCDEIAAQVEGAHPSPMHLALRLEELARHSTAAAAIAAAHGVGSCIVSESGMGAESDTNGNSVFAVVCGAARLVAEATPNGGAVLHGSIDLVPAAAYATGLLIACEEGSAAGVYVVRSDGRGVSVGTAPSLMGLAGSGTAPVSCQGVELGPEARVGDLDVAARIVAVTRIAHAAQAVGIAVSALDAALSSLTEPESDEDARRQRQSVQWMLADIATETEAARLSLWHAALETVTGDAHELAAMCRLLAAETAVAASRRAVQIVGEEAALRTSVFDRLYRDAKVMEVLGGTNEDQLDVIADALLPDLAP